MATSETNRLDLLLPAINGFLAVVTGAFGAHAVQDLDTRELLRTGAQYQLVHAVAAIAVLAAYGGSPRLKRDRRSASNPAPPPPILGVSFPSREGDQRLLSHPPLGEVDAKPTEGVRADPTDDGRARAGLAAALFGWGALVFAGSLDLLALTHMRVWGAVTPLGGLALLAGWVTTAAAIWTTRRTPH